MVLGFGRKKKSKSINGDDRSIRVSPSLPEMSSQGVAWPQNLVDVASIKQSFDAGAPPSAPATRLSFSSTIRAAIPFHKPFRTLSTGHGAEAQNGGDGGTSGGGRKSIASLYMSHHPPSAFPGAAAITKAEKAPPQTVRHSQRRARVATPFNLMVAGGQGTGKSSLLRLLVDTADVSPAATYDQRVAMDKFLRETCSPTTRIDTACIEICESKFDRVLLSVIDTPGLEFGEGRELVLERQVTSIMKYLDLQYADTMDEESKVLRRSKSDQHVHLCIYFIDPDSIVQPSRRVATHPSSPTSKATALPYTRRSDETEASDVQHEAEQFALSPADIRVLRRLSTRVNVLPVIARADTLTDERLTVVKRAITHALREVGLGYGVFDPYKPSEVPTPTPSMPHLNGNGTADPDTSRASTNGDAHTEADGGSDNEEEPQEEEPEERQSRRRIIKLNSRRRSFARSTSRSRLDPSEMRDDREPLPPDSIDADSVAAVRFSARAIAERGGVDEILPFALIMPEGGVKRRALKNAPAGVATVPGSRRDSVATMATQGGESENGHVVGSPSSKRAAKELPYATAPPKDLRGVFLRKFRWGTVDVLNPQHCDFAALRTGILSTHMKVCKVNTREVLYEKYRTEKLLARRATHNISKEDRERLLEGELQ